MKSKNLYCIVKRRRASNAWPILLGVLLFSGLSISRAQMPSAVYTVDLSDLKFPIRTGHLKLGSNRSPSGEILGANNFYFTKNSKPWYPVMGEFHFSRYPKAEWEEAVLKMKAAGINVIASYIFWIYHEEEEGKFDWSGNRDLRAFAELCKKHNMYFFCRIGPWCHGEVRNGGFPDWIVKRGNTRKSNPVYLQSVQQFFDQIGEQLKGLYFKDGGTVIGVQIENEFRFSHLPGLEHMLTLKKIARDAGIDVPYYTATGWPGSDQQQGELIPVWGGYPEAPWDSRTTALPLSDNYLFGPLSNDLAIGSDILANQDTAIVDLMGYPYPYATAEMGGGNQITYHRRPVIDAPDVAALAYVKIGSGANLVGYYMFHGGSNLIGKLSTLQESKATGYANDYPIINYDFYAPISEWGELRPAYRNFKVLHTFLNDFGSLVAGYAPAFPDKKPSGPVDDTTLRMAVRSKDNSGFVFISSFQRQVEMKDIEDVRFRLKFNDKTQLNFPSKPVTVKSGAQMIFPFNMDMNGVRLRYATAQPLCRLNDSVFVFFAPEGIAPEFLFDRGSILRIHGNATVSSNKDTYLLTKLKCGTSSLTELVLRGGKTVKIITLTAEQALNSWKTIKNGKEFLLISDCDIEFSDHQIHLKSTSTTHLKLSLFPNASANFSYGKVKVKADGIFTCYEVSLVPQKIGVSCEEVKEIKEQPNKSKLLPFDDRLQKPDSLRPGPQYQTNLQMLKGSRYWKINLQKSDLKGLNDAFIYINYIGDTGAMYLDGQLIADDFYAGLPMKIGLKRFNGKVKYMIFQVVPLKDELDIYFEKGLHPAPKSEPIADLESVTIVPQYLIKMTLVNESK